MTQVKLLNFSKGIVSSSLFARNDTVGYQTGLRQLRNMTIMRSGGIKNRAGTLFVAPAKNPGEAIRFVDFVFSAAAGQSYVLVFGDLYMWVVQAGQLLTDSDKTITGITQAAEGVVTATSHGFTNGRVVYLSGIVGMRALNSRWFKVSDATTHTFKLKSMAGDYIDTSGLDAYTSGGTASRVFELTTTYAAEDLPNLQWAQVADITRFTCEGYPVRRLTRTGHTSWAIADETFRPVAEPPVNTVGLSAATAGDKTLRYRITSVDVTGEESNHGLDPAKNISNLTLAGAITVHSTAHGLKDGDEVLIDGIVGTVSLNNRLFIVRSANPDNFTIEGEVGTGLPAYVSGGTIKRTHLTIALAAEPTDALPQAVTWTKSTTSTVKSYRVYREYGGIFGNVGETIGTRFDDKGFAPDTGFTPPVSFYGKDEPFSTATLYPAVCAHQGERLLLANSPAEPNAVSGSQVGGFLRNFGAHFPVLADDAFKFSIPGTQNNIRHLVDLRRLVIFTDVAEYVATGAEGGAISAGSKNVTQQSANGASRLRPLVVNGSLLYVQARGKSIRDFFADELAVEGYKGDDLTIFCDKLFRNRTIQDWAYQQIPDSIIWAVLDNGEVVGLTYIREQQMIGFHLHDTLGDFKNVCVIPEGNESAVYFAVERTVDGEECTYIERLSDRKEDEDHPERNVFVDCAATYNGWNTDEDHSQTISGSGWTSEDFLTATSSEPLWTADDVGNMLFLKSITDEGEETETAEFVRFRITAYTSPTVVTVLPDRDVPLSMRAVALTDWARAVDRLEGLSHLKGKNVSIQGDCFVDANPNNPNYSAVVTVDEDGAIDLPEGTDPRAVLHVGLPYVSDVETLDLDNPGGETLMTKKKLINSVGVYVEATRGLWAGEELPAADALAAGQKSLREFQPRRATNSYDDPELLTGVEEVAIKAHWNLGGRVVLRVLDPVQASILAIVPQGSVGGGR